MISRRAVLGGLVTAAASSAAGGRLDRANAEPPPETTTLRLSRVPSICVAPQYVAEELLRAEGFTDVQYVDGGAGGLPLAKATVAGRIDIAMNFAAPLVVAVDAGEPLVILAGIHVGCFELFGTGGIRTIKDLKGKKVAILTLDSAQHIFLSSMATLVGLDPRRDIEWVTKPGDEAKRLLAEGKIDAFLGFPPDPQELRAKKIGRVVVNSATDRPWSQYFCCMISANREFVRRHPVATKRAIRAIVKGDVVCALEPERAAHAFRARGYTTDPELVVQAIKEIPFGQWRQYDPGDTLRFYALRLHEAGMVKASPQRILAQGTDWRFINELKKELKG